VDSRWGYRRLDPIPSAEALGAFYESRYRDAIDSAGVAPDVARLVRGGADGDRERAWLAATLHADVLALAEGVVAEGLPRRALDIGAGTGDLVLALTGAGWDAVGTEPAKALAEVGPEAGARIEAMSAATFIDRWRADGARPFSLISLMNVLEHVPEPASLLQSLHEALSPRGRLLVRVPNDFNPLQFAAREALGRAPWWIAIPDHVNYFDHASIAALLGALGYEVIDQAGDFPMELFLLEGEDYTTDPAVGRAVHERRRRVELALPADTRRALGRAWAAAGVGRNALVAARRPA
jgi:SAM-dependent methyltransferase